MMVLRVKYILWQQVTIKAKGVAWTNEKEMFEGSPSSTFHVTITFLEIFSLSSVVIFNATNFWSDNRFLKLKNIKLF